MKPVTLPMSFKAHVCTCGKYDVETVKASYDTASASRHILDVFSRRISQVVMTYSLVQWV